MDDLEVKDSALFSGPLLCGSKLDVRKSILEDIINKVEDKKKYIIEREINIINSDKYIDNIILEELLKNNNDLLILPNIYIDNNIKNTLIKFLIITTKGIILISSRDLYGNVDVDNEGRFIKVYRNRDGIVYKKEVLANLINKNKHRMLVLKEILEACDVPLDIPIYSLVVIANSNVSVNIKTNNQAIIDEIVYLDELNNKINNILNTSTTCINHSFVIALKDYIYSLDKPSENDYLEQLFYSKREVKVDSNKNDDKLYDALYEYRSNKAKELNYSPYIVFNNDTLADLCIKRPTTKDELLRIKNFGIKKYDKYGEDILDIIKNN